MEGRRALVLEFNVEPLLLDTARPWATGTGKYSVPFIYNLLVKEWTCGGPTIVAFRRFTGIYWYLRLSSAASQAVQNVQ